MSFWEIRGSVNYIELWKSRTTMKNRVCFLLGFRIKNRLPLDSEEERGLYRVEFRATNGGGGGNQRTNWGYWERI